MNEFFGEERCNDGLRSLDIIWIQTTELKCSSVRNHAPLGILRLQIKPVNLLHLIKDERVLTVCNLLAHLIFTKDHF